MTGAPIRLAVRSRRASAGTTYFSLWPGPVWGKALAITVRRPVRRDTSRAAISAPSLLAAYGEADRVAAGGGVEGENEHINVEEVPLALLWTWVEQRKIEDLKSLALVFALRIRRPELFTG